MSLSAILRTQIDYTAWASLTLLDAVGKLPPEDRTRDFGTADGSILGTLAHIFAADRLWMWRVTGQPATVLNRDADRDLAVLQEVWPALLERWKAFAADVTDERAELPISYTDLQENPRSPLLWQVILHLVNHGTHHRGQVCGFLRSLGHKPPILDAIQYYREIR